MIAFPSDYFGVVNRRIQQTSATQESIDRFLTPPIGQRSRFHSNRDAERAGGAGASQWLRPDLVLRKSSGERRASAIAGGQGNHIPGPRTRPGLRDAANSLASGISSCDNFRPRSFPRPRGSPGSSLWKGDRGCRRA